MDILTDKFDSFGLDIGDRSVKSAYIRKKGSGFAVESFGTETVPNNVFDRGTIRDPQTLASCIRNLISKSGPKKINTKYVHACLPETHTFIKLLTIDAVEEDNVGAKIREILPSHFPIDIKDSYIDWRIINSDSQKQAMHVLAGAVPKNTADAYTQILINSGLIPLSLQIEAEAIQRAVMEQRGQKEGPCAIIDIGATRSSFILHDEETIQFTVSLPTAGEKITKIISEKMNFSFEEAERAKCQCGFDRSKCEKSIADILEEEVEKLVDSIQKNMSFYTEHFQNSGPVSSVILCGGGANLIGLTQAINKRLPNISISFGKYDLSYTTAIGLGLSNVL